MVVNDFSIWTLSLFPEVSFTPVVILILYTVWLLDKEPIGSRVNVVFPTEATGEEAFIATQLEKSVLDN